MEATHYGPDDEEQLDYEVTRRLKQAISTIDSAERRNRGLARLNECLALLLEATDQNTRVYQMLKRHDEIYKHHVHFTDVVEILARLGRMLRDTNKKYYAFIYPKDATYATSAAGLTALLGRLRLRTC